MYARMLAELIDAADPAVSATSSYEDYHVSGLSYVNLLRTPQLTAKLYITEPGIQHNQEGWLVSPHDHAYRFDTYVAQGWVRSILFEESPSADLYTRFGVRGSSMNSEMPYHGRAYLHLRSTHRITIGESYHMTENEIHTISVAPNQRTVLFLLQYHRRKDGTSLFMSGRRSKGPSLEGLYRPMSKTSVACLLSEVRETMALKEQA